MGQVALGLKNLAIKLAIFVIMAALLAWALGGTLWPRAEIVDRPAVKYQGQDCFWRLTVGGKEPGVMRWVLMSQGDEEKKPMVVDGTRWVEVAGPIIAGDRLYFAGRKSFDTAETWRIGVIQEIGHAPEYSAADDRFAVERQFAALVSEPDVGDGPVDVDPTGDLADDADGAE